MKCLNTKRRPRFSYWNGYRACIYIYQEEDRWREKVDIGGGRSKGAQSKHLNLFLMSGEELSTRHLVDLCRTRVCFPMLRYACWLKSSSSSWCWRSSFIKTHRHYKTMMRPAPPLAAICPSADEATNGTVYIIINICFSSVILWAVIIMHGRAFVTLLTRGKR